MSKAKHEQVAERISTLVYDCVVAISKEIRQLNVSEKEFVYGYLESLDMEAIVRREKKESLH